MGEYDIGISTQTPIHYFAGDFLGAVMPEGNVHMPVRDMIDAGIHTANGSDAPVTFPNWKQGVETAVLREGLASGNVIGEDQRISIEEAIRMYTIEGAWQDHKETVEGSIEVGKFADFCILDEDILTVEPHTIDEISTLMTIVGGRIVNNSGYLFLE